jgi:hypothetical protein
MSVWGNKEDSTFFTVLPKIFKERGIEDPVAA